MVELRSDWHPLVGQVWMVVDLETGRPLRFASGPGALERARQALDEVRRQRHERPRRRTVEARARLLAMLRREDESADLHEAQDHAARCRRSYDRAKGRP